jgi:CBS domain-containing protein
MADIKVREVMTEDVITLSPDDTILEAARALAGNGISGAPVVEKNKIAGVVSEADLIEAAMPRKARPGTSILDRLSEIVTGRPGPRGEGINVSDVMTSNVLTIGPEDSVWKAAHQIETRGVNRLPVVDEDDHVVGIVSRADIVKAMAHDDARIKHGVEDAISILGPGVIEDLVVEAKDGVVTLRGSADRRSTHELAVRLTARCPGVLKIIDSLTHEIDDNPPKVPAATDVFAPSVPPSS